MSKTTIQNSVQVLASQRQSTLISQPILQALIMDIEKKLGLEITLRINQENLCHYSENDVAVSGSWRISVPSNIIERVEALKKEWSDEHKAKTTN